MSDSMALALCINVALVGLQIGISANKISKAIFNVKELESIKADLKVMQQGGEQS